jgi:HD-GYP domain-containing protein (c-di-GMP phosphodiesterase class II)
MPDIRTAPRATDLPPGSRRPGPGSTFRLVEPLAALSRMSDIARGRPDNEALRACLLATALGREIGATASDASDIFYTALLRFVGCTATSHEYAATFGDDIRARSTGDLVDATPRAGIAWLLSLTDGAAPWTRAAALARTLPGVRGVIREGARADCEVGALMAACISLSGGVQQGLAHLFERWDGLGPPNGVRGEEIALPARVAAVAYVAVIVESADGPDAAKDFVASWSGKALDPQVAAAFTRRASDLLTEASPGDPWTAVVNAEPGDPIAVADDRLDDIAAAFGDATDLKSPVFTGHSAAVARLASGAASAADIDHVGLRRAGYLHDLGRAGIATGIWEKGGPLNRAEWEQVRLHAYQTERILSGAPTLAPLAAIAGRHHERADGSGYHRGLAGSGLDRAARILAAADAYQAMTSERPHRPAFPPKAAAEQLRAMPLGEDAVDAVLEAIGEPAPARRATHPAGLSDREVEVLRLLANGRSVKEIASGLVVSASTVHTHVVHIYEKAGVRTRAGATMFAMQHGLVTAAG